jgi:hypothetical protein
MATTDPANGALRALPLRALLHPTERSRMVLATATALIAVIVGVLIAIAVHRAPDIAVAAFVVLFVVASFWLGVQVRRAMLLGRSVHVTERSLPAVQSVIDEVRVRLDYHRSIDVYVADKVPGGESVAVISCFGTKMIVMEGGLIGDLLTPEKRPQLTFLLARYVGAFKARHMRMDLLEIMISAVSGLRIVNVFLKPYFRATAYSGDQIGLACCGELNVALAATSRLLTGKDVAPSVVAPGVIDQAALVSRRMLPRLGQLMSREPHLTNRFLNLLFFAHVHHRDEWDAFLARVDTSTARELAILGARSPHTEGLIGAPRSRGGTRRWQDDLGTVVSAAGAMLAGALLAGSVVAEHGGLRETPKGALVVDAALVLGVLVAGTVTVWRRAPGWAAATALIAAALAGWTDLVPAIDVHASANALGVPADELAQPLSTAAAQLAAIVAIVAVLGLTVSWRQQPITTDRRPTKRSRAFAAGAVAGGALVVASSFLPRYQLPFDEETITLWQANLGVVDGVVVALGAALACAGLVGLVTRLRGAPWLTVLLACVTFGLVLTPQDLGRGYGLGVGWWLALGGAVAGLACALLAWVTAGPRWASGGGARVWVPHKTDSATAVAGI